MIYDSNADTVPFRNVTSSTNFIVDGQLCLKVVNPETTVNCVNLSTNRLWYVGHDVLVKVVKVKIVDVK